MPPRNWQLRIEDIIECIDKISRYTQGMDMAPTAHRELPPLVEPLRRILHDNPLS